MTTEQVKNYLSALQQRLREIEQVKDEGVNIFSAVGMRTQEIKHSAFLAWLLNPRQPHGLKNKFLKKLLEKLLRKNIQKPAKYALTDLTGFINADDLSVETEKTISGNDSRMDIFIQSHSAKTVLVIENKVFTSTHDNQLARYEEKLSDLNDNEWKKIFVYLTPKCDKPTEDGQERENWCVFGYADILEIAEEILRTKLDIKVKLLMEDYISMVETNILKGNKELRSLCRQIRREHKEALEILMSYTDNADEVMAYCAEWSRRNFNGLTVIKEGKRSFEFYTPSMLNYVNANNENILNGESGAKLRVGFGYSETVAVGISLQKGKDEEWSVAQNKIIAKYASEKKASDRYISLNGTSVVLVSEKDREIAFEAIKPDIDLKLEDFKRKLIAFEEWLMQN